MSPLEILIFLPLLAAIAIGLKAPGRAVSLLAALINLVLVAGLLVQYHQNHPEGGYAYQAAFVVLDAPQIRFAVGADGLSLVMALLTTLVTAAAAWSTVGKDRLYYVSILLISAGALGAFLSTDIFFIYAFHELALIPTFLMLAFYGYGERKAVAWKITLYLGAASLVLLAGLAGLVWMCSPGGSLTFDLLALQPITKESTMPLWWSQGTFLTLLIGFGALVSLFPFHTWAAPAYAAAPTPIAMMHAGVLKKFGLYGLIRLALPLLPEAANTAWIQNLLLWLIIGNVLVIGFVTINQRRLDDMLANSSVMHMGYIFLGIAAGNALALNGAILLMFAHGISIALLFMLCGKIRNQVGTLEFDRLGGLAGTAPFISVVFGISAFASIGLPGLANFAGEVLVFLGAFHEYRPNQGITMLQGTTIACLWGVVISAVYMLRAYRQIFFGKASTGLYVSDPNMVQKAPMIVLTVVLFAVGCQPGLILRLIETSVSALGIK